MLPKRRIRHTSRKKTKTFFLSVGLLCLFLTSILSFVFFTTNTPKIISPIPKVEGSQNNSVDGVKEATDLLHEYGLEAKTVRKGNADMLFVGLKSGEEVTLSTKKDLDVQISSLHLILARLTIEGKKAVRLDFRFEKPAIMLAK